MGKLNGFSKGCSAFGATLVSMVRVVILSRGRKVKFPDVACGKELVVLGNGPSIVDLLSNYTKFLSQRTCMAVNFSLNSEIIFNSKPQLYVLADPYFFTSIADERVRQLWDNINKVSWQMTLFVPYGKKVDALLNNSNVKVLRYNMTPIEGFKSFTHFAFNLGFGMPRPRNVLIAATMLGIACGFKRIYLAGAEHSWLKNLVVDDNNRLGVAFPHFYENNKEKERVQYLNRTLADELESLRIAFNSYQEIRAYADSLPDVKILNITPGSYIDSFERYKPECD